jgi:phenylpropionate dioxygenase-like ring-hydroxylating dioxygenase large terminal subunit
VFLAHKNDNKGGYIPVTQLKNNWVVVNTEDPFLVSNVCPHQNSLISVDEGTGNRTCPYHNWTFTLDGQPLTSGRTGHYCKNEKALEKKDVYTLNNMLFSLPVNCPEISFLDLSHMNLIEHRIDRVAASADKVMDIFLDVDHIQTIHAGVYDRVGMPNIDNSTVDWHYYNWGSLQLVRKQDQIGAVWLAVYPGTMIEWQEGALFVTIAVDTNTGCDVFVFKYKDSRYGFGNWRTNDEMWEIAWKQDREQAELIKKLPQHNLEESKKHFRAWNKS